jgi:hypothetical protein
MDRILLLLYMSAIALALSGCEMPGVYSSETLASAEGGLRSPVIEKGPCSDTSFGTTVINPMSAEYRALTGGVEQIVILSEFRRAYFKGVRGDDPMLKPFYDALDWSESMIGPFALEIIDGVERVLDQNGIPVVMPFDTGFENEPDYVTRQQAIAAFFAAERLGVRSSDPRLTDLYSVLSTERSVNEEYALGFIAGTNVTEPVRCN